MALRRLSRVSCAVFLVLGACALRPAARVARAGDVPEPVAASPTQAGVEERFEPRVHRAPSADEAEAESAAAKPSARARKSARRASAKKTRRAKSETPAEPPADVPPAPPSAPAPLVLPASLDVDPRALSARRCRALLEEHGVKYAVAEGATSEAFYVRPLGDIGGVTYEFEGRRQLHEVMDCRLVVALLRWAPRLRAEGVRAIRHLSVYRPDARVASSGKRSGHASALAIDVRFLEMEDGRTLDVLVDWGNRERGLAPCGEGVGEGDPSHDIRRIVCAAVEAALFQTVITPHHDDLHQNHVHLELVPGVDWTFIR